MSPNAVVWWVTLLAAVVTLGLAGMQAARALRELKRFKARVAGYGDLPVLKAVARAEQDAQRLQGAVASIAPLVERAQAALAVIRRGPIPPELLASVRGVRAEIDGLRHFASR